MHLQSWLWRQVKGIGVLPESQAGPCCRQNTDPSPNFSAMEDLAKGSKEPEGLGTVSLEQLQGKAT